MTKCLAAEYVRDGRGLWAMRECICGNHQQGDRHVFGRWTLNVQPPGAETLQARYHELLFAVESKHGDETRHDTALRYIRERECRPVEAGQPGGRPQKGRS